MTVELVAEAHARGHDASHINLMSLLGYSDRALLPKIVGGDFTFVTNNRRDFLALYRQVDLHAGLLIILPSVNVAGQVRLFLAALEAIEARGADLINQLVEVDADGTVTFTSYPFEGDDG